MKYEIVLKADKVYLFPYHEIVGATRKLPKVKDTLTVSINRYIVPTKEWKKVKCPLVVKKIVGKYIWTEIK